jgi:hypothetical protein
MVKLIHYPTPPHLPDTYANGGWGTGNFLASETMNMEFLSLFIRPHLGLVRCAGELGRGSSVDGRGVMFLMAITEAEPAKRSTPYSALRKEVEL